jgi:hypothetical protein
MSARVSREGVAFLYFWTLIDAALFAVNLAGAVSGYSAELPCSSDGPFVCPAGQQSLHFGHGAFIGFAVFFFFLGFFPFFALTRWPEWFVRLVEAP